MSSCGLIFLFLFLKQVDDEKSQNSMTIMRMISKAGSMTAPHPQQQKQLPHTSCQGCSCTTYSHWNSDTAFSADLHSAELTQSPEKTGKTNGSYYPSQKVFHILISKQELCMIKPSLSRSSRIAVTHIQDLQHSEKISSIRNINN